MKTATAPLSSSARRASRLAHGEPGWLDTLAAWLLAILFLPLGALLVVVDLLRLKFRLPLLRLAGFGLLRPLPSQVVAEGAQLWIGNDRFMAFDIQASREQLAPKWVKHEQEWFVAPVQKFGPTLVHVRRRRGSHRRHARGLRCPVGGDDRRRGLPARGPPPGGPGA